MHLADWRLSFIKKMKKERKERGSFAKGAHEAVKREIQWERCLPLMQTGQSFLGYVTIANFRK